MWGAYSSRGVGPATLSESCHRRGRHGSGLARGRGLGWARRVGHTGHPIPVRNHPPPSWSHTTSHGGSRGLEAVGWVPWNAWNPKGKGENRLQKGFTKQDSDSANSKLFTEHPETLHSVNLTIKFKFRGNQMGAHIFKTDFYLALVMMWCELKRFLVLHRGIFLRRCQYNFRGEILRVAWRPRGHSRLPDIIQSS